jgi:hypothetical protein
MAIDERFFISAPLDQYFVDKDTGLPLAGGTLEFFRDADHDVPKDVYQLTGSPPNYGYTPFPNPIVLSSVGTVQNASGDNEIIYFFPYDGTPDNTNGTIDLYHIVCKSAGGVEQWTRDGWPGLTPGNDPTQNDVGAINGLSNCQFSRTLLNPDNISIYTVAGASSQVFAFAPDWDFVISGTGDVVVERVPVSGNDNIVSSPSHVLQVNVAATVTACYLRQRLPKNSGLFSGGTLGGFLSGNFVAKNELTGTVGIDLLYEESGGATVGSPITIVSGNVTDTYGTKDGAVAIPPSNNPDSGDDAYVDIYLSFQPNSVTRVTSVQISPTLGDTSLDIVPFNEISANRDQARMGDYYIPRLEEKPIQSLLTGWDFPLNPAQELGDDVTVDTTAKYVWDQTIMESITNDVDVSRNAITGGMDSTNGAGAATYYMLQYLTGAEAKKILGTSLSVNINAYKSTFGASATCRAYLYSGTSAAVFPDLTMGDTIGTINAGGTFTLTEANWTEIPRRGLETAEVDIKTIVTSDDINSGVDYGFNGWEIIAPAVIADTDKFAIVVTCFMPDADTEVTVNSISVVPGDIPTRPAPQTIEEVLQECEYYWEKSYATETDLGTDTFVNSRTSKLQVDILGGSPYRAFLSDFFEVVYRNTKVYDTPVISFYSKVGTVDNVSAVAYDGLSAPPLVINDAVFVDNWTQIDIGSKSVSYYPINSNILATGALVVPQSRGAMIFHYTANARLGEAEYL